jgi:hypothetical protein
VSGTISIMKDSIEPEQISENNKRAFHIEVLKFSGAMYSLLASSKMFCYSTILRDPFGIMISTSPELNYLSESKGSALFSCF